MFVPFWLMVAGGWGDWRPSFYPSHEMLMVAGGWRPSHETILLMIAGGWEDIKVLMWPVMTFWLPN